MDRQPGRDRMEVPLQTTQAESALRNGSVEQGRRAGAEHRGFVIAIVGGDAAGKSTVIEELHNWLAASLPVAKAHMGHPGHSPASVPILALLKIGSMLGLCPPDQAESGAETAFPGYAWLIRRACIAHDRYYTYRKARRLSSQGAVVLLDRYPLPGLWMDGPQCARICKRFGKANPFLTWLTELEDGCYREIGLPDLLIVLKLDPEIAVRRKTWGNPERVRARSTLIAEFDWSQIAAHVVDASLPRGDVLSKIKSVICANLQK